MQGPKASKPTGVAADGSLTPRGPEPERPARRSRYGVDQGAQIKPHQDPARPIGSTVERLARLAQRVAGARSAEEVARAIARYAPDVLDAHFASVAVIGVGDDLHLLYNDALRPELAARFASVPRRSRIPATAALDRDETVFVPDLATLAQQFPDLSDSIKHFAVEALACAPLRVSGSPSFGVLTIGWAEARELDADTRALVEAIADLCAPSVARARLTDRLALRTAQFAELAQKLAAARTTSEVAAIVAGGVVAVVDAKAASVGLIDAVAGVLRVHHGPAVTAEMVALYASPPIDAPLLFTEVARTGVAVYLADYNEYTRRFPGTDPANAGLGVGARAAVPLRDSVGASFGALVFSWDHRVEFEGAVSSVLSTLAELVGQTLERARLADAEHQLVNSFQQRMLAPIPAVEGLCAAGVYLPASVAIGMGGDWYEGITLDGDRFGLIVGDVAGHGIPAVADMAHLRSILAAFLRIGLPLEEIVGAASEALGPTSTLTASAFVAVVDPRRQVMDYLLVGHPPPVLVVDGLPTLLADPRQPLIGVEADRRVVGVVPFPAGSTLVVYTDGLIERRRESMQQGLDQLLEVVGHAVDLTDVEAVAGRILEACLGDQPAEDDVAIVVIRSAVDPGAR